MLELFLAAEFENGRAAYIACMHAKITSLHRGHSLMKARAKFPRLGTRLALSAIIIVARGVKDLT